MTLPSCSFHIYKNMKMKLKKGFIIISLVLFAVAGIYGFLLHNQKNTLPAPYIKLYLHNQEIVVDMNLEDYIKGTLAAEMPASFEMEALKAQAVCARTYAVKKLIDQHSYPEGADLSDDINSCQAFVALQNYASQNPRREELLKRINEAVESTRGEIILYNSQPIDALYCSTCGGRTEAAGDVWGTEIMYLQSVECGYCSESKHYINETTVSNSTLNQIAGGSGNPLNIKVISRTRGGRPQILDVNGHQVNSGALRKALNLPSNWMEFKSSTSSTIIYTHGYGHGVGLCQYGANGMAKAGKDYHQILKKYYQGINFYKLGY